MAQFKLSASVTACSAYSGFAAYAEQVLRWEPLRG